MTEVWKSLGPCVMSDDGIIEARYLMRHMHDDLTQDEEVELRMKCANLFVTLARQDLLWDGRLFDLQEPPHRTVVLVGYTHDQAAAAFTPAGLGRPV